MLEILPYGSWPSPITASSLVEGASQISEVQADPVRPDLLWWAETRPDDDGRTALMRCRLGSASSRSRNGGAHGGASIGSAGAGPVTDASSSGSGLEVIGVSEATPADANVRTRVHEYGGGAWWPHDGVLYYVDAADQRLRKLRPAGSDDEPVPAPVLLTPEPVEAAALRYADGRITADGRWCVCVRERHGAERSEPSNELVAVPADGSQQVELLWAGSDFVMSPRISPDGAKLAWIAWDRPHMPWDAARLHVHELDGWKLGAEILVIGEHGDRSLCEPGWIPPTTRRGEGAAGRSGDDRLLVCSDHEGWWGLYEAVLGDGTLVPLVSGEFDVATPPWVFGMQRWAFAGSKLVAAARFATGDRLIVADLASGDAVPTAGPADPSGAMPSRSSVPGFVEVSEDSSIASLTALGGRSDSRPGDPAAVAYAGVGYCHETEVVALTVCDAVTPPTRRVVRPSRQLGLARSLLTKPEAITFQTTALPGRGACEASAHALYYPPANPDCEGPPAEKPPLLVLAHGGPTASARRELQLDILFWTSRGIAVADVDYRGSTGYGRRYRQALNGEWGVADAHDCVNAARFLAARGDVDPEKLVIRGSSAGGFTVLAALAFHDVFAAGSSRYGIADLELLLADTHKFESHYLDTLIGPWPEARHVYGQRSPIRNLDGFNAPMIVLQGTDDEIVPPNQAELIVEALESKGVPVSYVLFEGEQHGFRRAENIIAALEAELAFFTSVLGLS